MQDKDSYICCVVSGGVTRAAGLVFYLCDEIRAKRDKPA